MRQTSRSTIGMVCFLLVLFSGAAVSFAGVTYTYDGRGRVTAGLNDNGLIVNYAYDMAGNRLSVTSANALDFDFDGLPDSVETGHACLDPNDADTDDDGIIDGFEDANHDGVWDQAAGETNPCLADSDGDGLQDGTESGYSIMDVGPGTDPALFVPDLDPSSTTDPTITDSDNDGLSDGAEDPNHNGRMDSGETDPGINDNAPVLINTDPADDSIVGGVNQVTVTLSDPDGVDGASVINSLVMRDRSGAPVAGVTVDAGAGVFVFTPTGSPLTDGTYTVSLTAADPAGNSRNHFFGFAIDTTDSDNDGLIDALENAGCTDPDNVDTDNDELLDGAEDANHNGVVDEGETDPCDTDTDNDGWSDESEDRDHDGVWDKGDPYETDETCPYLADSDGDGLQDGTEYDLTLADIGQDTDQAVFIPDQDPSTATYPMDADTDDDGIVDGAEDANHNGRLDAGETDPCNPDSDGDGIQDGTELGLTLTDVGPDTDPALFVPDLDPSSTTDPTLTDSDNDGQTDGAEDPNHNGRMDENETDPAINNNAPLLVNTIPADDSTVGGVSQVTVTLSDPDGVDGATVINSLTVKDSADQAVAGATVEAGDAGDSVFVYTPVSGALPPGAYTVSLTAADPSGNSRHYVFTFAVDTTDSDNDGLPDVLENTGCTSLNDPDTDGDGVWDGIEDANHNGRVDDGETDPCDADSDDDGIIDGFEDINFNGAMNIGETDPRVADTDGDGLQDGTELGYTVGHLTDTDLSVFISDADPTTTTHPLIDDTDGDGLTDGQEDADHNGRVDEGETDPTYNYTTDSDNDNLPDVLENAGCTDPNNLDTDGDGVWDGIEDANHTGVKDDGETDPCDADTDDDGLLDGFEDINANGSLDIGETDPRLADTDGDGIQDGTEQGKILADIGPDTDQAVFVPDADPATTTHPLNNDTDGDGLTDGQEDADHNGRVDAGESDPNTNIVTFIDEDIDGDVTWTKANSPYIIVGDIYVKNNATLTVEPGVVVRFNAGKGLYIGTESSGALSAIGTESEPIVFTSNAATPAPRDWCGIHFDAHTDTTATAVIYCIVEYGGGGSGGGNLVYTNIIADDPFIRNNTIQYGLLGIRLIDSSITIYHNTIKGNVVGGIYIIGNDCDSAVISCNNIMENGCGLCTYYEAQPTIHFNNIMNNSYGGIHSYNTSDIIIADNNWWNNANGPRVVGGGFIGYGDMIRGKVTVNSFLTDESDCCIHISDSDNDGLYDYIENASGCLNPNNPDTDGDGLRDGVEDAYHDGEVDLLIYESNPCDADTDDDGLADGVEDVNHNGAVDDGETCPFDADTDWDGIQDGTESGLVLEDIDSAATDTSVFIPDADPSTTTSPFNYDTDGDYVEDGGEDTNYNGRVDAGETDPNHKADSDNDGLPDDMEHYDCINPETSWLGCTDPADADSDDDGIQDGTECGLTLEDIDPSVTDTSVFVPDADPDTGTNPTNRDTDGDGRSDGDEDSNHNGKVDAGETDPNLNEFAPVLVGTDPADGSFEVSVDRIMITLSDPDGVDSASVIDSLEVVNGDGPPVDGTVVVEAGVGSGESVFVFTPTSGSLPDEFYYEVYLTATDALGNAREHSFGFTVNTVPDELTVNVTTNAGDPLSNVSVYAFSASGSYTGLNTITDADGAARFAPGDFADGSYKFRVDYLGSQFWTDTIVMPGTASVDKVIDVQTVEVTVSTDAGAAEGVPVYVFTGNGAYLGLSAATGADGQAVFTLPVGEGFLFRADILSSQYWSEVITVSAAAANQVPVEAGGGQWAVSVKKDGQEPMEGISVYLFKDNGAYLNKNQVTDGDGTVSFDVPEGTYKARADYLGYQFWTDAAAINDDAADDLNIAHDDAGIEVVGLYQGTADPLEGLNVYLFSEAGAYMNLNRITDAVGRTAFNLPERAYKARADFLGKHYWSGVFTWEDRTIEIPMADAEITVLDGVPLSGVPVYVFSEADAYLGISGATDVDGKVRFRLPAGAYKFRADYQNNQFWSGTAQLTADQNNPVNIHTGGGVFALTVMKGETLPLIGADCYAFDENSAYLGLTDVTDSSGQVGFDLSDGDYKFRVNYLGYMYWSELLTVPDTLGETMTIAHQDTQITVNSFYQGTVQPLAGVNTYLFTDSAVYMNRTKATDAAGQAIFNLPEQPYKVRADYLSRQYWSEIFTWQDKTITIPLAEAEITVTGNGQPLSGIPIYVFNNAGAYLNISGVSASGGQATFRLPAGNYKFRADYQGSQYWSAITALTADQVNPIPISVGGGTFTLTILKNATDALVGASCYLFTGAGAYLNKSAVTSSEGQVSFELADGTYKIRVDYLGYQFWTSVFTIPSSLSEVLTIPHKNVAITVTKDYQGQTPLAGIPVYLFKPPGTYLSQSRTTDADGRVVFYLPDQAYKVRADYLGSQFWSANFQFADTAVTIPHNLVKVHVHRSGVDVPGAVVYLFSGAGSYLNRNLTTDSAGIVEFTLPEKAFKFRADQGGAMVYSSVVNVLAGQEQLVEIDLD